MKHYISQKDTKSNFKKVFKIRYCEIKSIEYFLNPEAYNSGIYGWNYDLYAFRDNAISTGYRPIGAYISDDSIKHINEIARKFHKMCNANMISYNAACKQCYAEICDFLNKLNEVQL